MVKNNLINREGKIWSRLKRSYEKTLVLKPFFPWIPDFPRIMIFLKLRLIVKNLDLSFSVKYLVGLNVRFPALS